MGVLSLLDYYHRTPSRQVFNSTLYSINKEYSAINFITPESKVRSDIEKETDLRYYYVSSAIEKWLAVIVLGLFIGIIGSIQGLLIEEMVILKNNVLRETMQDGIIGSSLLWICWTVLPIIICSFLIIELAPTLKGCGVSSATAYLNGVRIKKFNNGLTLLLLYISIFLISAANMPGGREELVIYLGALSGAYITRMKIPFTNKRPLQSVSNPIFVRTLVGAGIAAGVSVAFGTPIGAVLFCLEEGISFWSAELTSMMFLCAICSNFVLNLTYTIYHSGKDFSFNLKPYLFFSGANHISLTFKFSEIPIFILMGIFGGLMGSAWNEAQILLRTFRNHYINTKAQRIIEVAILGLDISLCSILTFHFFGADCTREVQEPDREAISIHMKVYCKNDDEFETVGIFLFQDLRHTIESFVLLTEELVTFPVLLFGCIYYYVFSELQLGTNLPTGVLTPHLVSGATWGYLIGIWYSHASEGNTTVAKYAFLGAVAQGSGAARLTLSLGIIMIESCGKQIFSLPIFIIVVTAKWFGGIFSRPIYHIARYLEGYPFLRATHLPLSTPYKAKHIMIAPIVHVKPRMTIKGLIKVLMTNHLIFPVIENEKVVGIITKYQIAVILKSKIYNFPEDIDRIHLMHEMIMQYEGGSFSELEEVIHSEDNVRNADSAIDLTKFMCISTYLINLEMSLRKIYSMFVALGLSYVIVVDDNLNAIGIITRKDIACFRKISQFMLVRTEVIPLRRW